MAEKIVMTNGQLQVSDSPIIPFIEGDGVGHDIWKNAQAIFDKAVEARVDERLTQKAPRKGTGPVSMTKAEIMAIENDEERQAMIAANIGLFKN